MILFKTLALVLLISAGMVLSSNVAKAQADLPFGYTNLNDHRGPNNVSYYAYTGNGQRIAVGGGYYGGGYGRPVLLRQGGFIVQQRWVTYSPGPVIIRTRPVYYRPEVMYCQQPIPCQRVTYVRARPDCQDGWDVHIPLLFDAHGHF